MILLGVDTGGTFTDFILYKEDCLITHKVLSTPGAPELAILQGIRDLNLHDTEFSMVHGSTVATNALLEGKGATTVYITNHGLADVLTIGRQTRRELYNLQPEKIQPPVAKTYCLETCGRVSASGEVIEALTQQHLDALLEQIRQLQPEAVAINLLFSYINSDAEKKIAASMPASLFVSRSSAVLAEYKEYERGIATWLNSYVGPLVKGYLQRLQKGTESGENSAANIAVMQSSGGTIAAEHAGQQAVNMLLSGPAGGLAAAKFIGELTGQKRILTFDMGGTSTDVSMINGELSLTNEGEIAGYPVAVPMVDMHTIGAGGGSIARVDAGGLLQVGPESAGADPGPACYGKANTEHVFATVTDANLILGRLRADAFLGGEMSLDVDAARDAVAPIAAQLHLSIEETAAGIIRIANEHMAHALRVMSVQRGIDPRDLSLVSFGGAGGLHVCALADALTMSRAVVPRYAGVLSALGMLVAPRTRQLSKTINSLLDVITQPEIEKYFAALYQQGRDALVSEGLAEKDLVAEYSLDCRYAGQSYFLNVRWDGIEKVKAAFHQLHEKRYGHQLELAVELVNVRLAIKGQSMKMVLPELEKNSATLQAKAQVSLYGYENEVPVFERDALYHGAKFAGPALITETVSTTYLASNWQCEVEKNGCLILSRK